MINILDHIGIVVSNTEKSRAFYTETLKPLDIHFVMDIHTWVSFGRNGIPKFWFGQAYENMPDVTPRIHIAFTAESRKQVDEFYAAALKAGGADNGPPGLRPEYHKDYYGAFVIDPDGHNIEAVCHKPE